MDRSTVFHIAFYRFVRLDDPEAVVTLLRDLTRQVLGSVLVAREGLNGTLAGSASALDDVEAALRTDPRLGGRFSDLVFQRTACPIAG